MPRRKSAAYMSAGEQIAGTVLFVIYLLVLPFVTAPLFRLIGGLLGVTISTGLQNILYYYILFAATVIIFHGFLGRTSRHFAENLGGACKFMAIGLVALCSSGDWCSGISGARARRWDIWSAACCLPCCTCGSSRW